MKLPHRRQFLHLAVGAAALPALPRIAKAQAYPLRPVRIVVGFPPGGPPDIAARVLAERFSEAWGRPVVVENATGSGGNLAVERAARAQPDGYTLLMASNAIVINPGLYAKLPYDSIKDFAPITLAATSPLILVVHPGFAAKNVKELIAIAKAEPGKHSYASPGTGTASHLASELFRLSFGLDLIHVPFNGAAPSIVSTVGGHTPIVFSAVAGVAANVREGKLRALGVTTAERSKALPDVPTVAETVPGYEASVWYGIAGPKGMPPEVVDSIYLAFKEAMGEPKVNAYLEQFLQLPWYKNPAEYRAFAEKYYVDVKPLLIKAGLAQG